MRTRPQSDAEKESRRLARTGWNTAAPLALNILLTIHSLTKKQRYPPSMQDIAEHLGIRSTTAIVKPLNKLLKIGMVTRIRGPKGRGTLLIAVRRVEIPE